RTGATPSARSRDRRWPRGRGWSSRTSWPAAPRRARAPPRSLRSSRGARGPGRERVDVDLALELVVLGAAVAVALDRRPGAHERPPRRREPVRRALGVGRDPVAVARWLARERDRAARLQHAPELRERAVEVREGVQHG